MLSTHVPVLLRSQRVPWEIDATAEQIRAAIASGVYTLPGAAGAVLTCTRASAALQQAADGTWASVAENVPAIDWISGIGAYGLRVEEARTNSIRNNTMQGAVAGTPGTAPTNWSMQSTGTGLTRQIVGTGTEDGLTYIEVRLSGTASINGSFQISADGTTAIAASTGQTWTGSFFVGLVSGTLPGISSVLLIERNSGGTLLTSVASTVTSPTTASLGSQRVSYSRTFANASTAYATCRYDVLFTSGQTVDFTIRIAAPQLELGAFVTSPILTTNGAATRDADQLSVSNTAAGFIGQSAGTLLADVRFLSATHTAVRNVISIDDGTADNRIALRSDVNANAGDGGEMLVVSGGVTQADITNSTDFTTSLVRVAAAYATDDFALYRAGASVGAPDTSGSVPATTSLRIGQDYAGASQLNGYVTRVRVAKTRTPAAQLASLTQ